MEQGQGVCACVCAHTHTYTHSHFPSQRVALYSITLLSDLVLKQARKSPSSRWPKPSGETYSTSKDKKLNRLRPRGFLVQIEGHKQCHCAPLPPLAHVLLLLSCFSSSTVDPKKDKKLYMLSFQNIILRCSSSSSLMVLNQI